MNPGTWNPRSYCRYGPALVPVSLFPTPLRSVRESRDRTGNDRSGDKGRSFTHHSLPLPIFSPCLTYHPRLSPYHRHLRSFIPSEVVRIEDEIIGHESFYTSIAIFLGSYFYSESNRQVKGGYTTDVRCRKTLIVNIIIFYYFY